LFNQTEKEACGPLFYCIYERPNMALGNITSKQKAAITAWLYL